MPRNPQSTDLRIMVPRRSMAAWNRVAGRVTPLLKSAGVEETPSNLLAVMLEILDVLDNPNNLPSADPTLPFVEWADGKGMTIASGRLGRRLEPGASPKKDRGTPIRPAPKAGRKRKVPPASDVS